jgi:plasmid stabilization system protein ParE
LPPGFCPASAWRKASDSEGDNAVRPHPTRQSRYFHISSYIAYDNEYAADRVEQAILQRLRVRYRGSMRGRSRPDNTTRSLRFSTLTRFPNYAVGYRTETAPLEIVAVMHGKRSIRRILRKRW